MRYSDVVFDVDGTLVDNEQSVLLTWQECLQKYLGRRYEMNELTFVLGLPGMKTMELLEIEIADPKAAFDDWEAMYQKHGKEIAIFKGVDAMLTQLKRMGLRLGIVTSRLPSELYNCPAMKPLLHLFDHAICVTDTPRSKPDADPLLAYMDKAKASPEYVLYVGDSRHDRDCARNAEVDFALAKWGGGAEEDGTEKGVLRRPSALYSLL